MKKIMFIVPVLSHGGAERVVSVLSSQMAEMGYDVEIILYSRSQKEYPVSPKASIFVLSAHVKFIRKIQRPLQIRKYVKNASPDIIIPFLPPSVVETYFACLGLKIPTIGTVRNNPNCEQGLLNKTFLRILPKMNAIFCQTVSQKELLSETCQSKAFVLPNPVSPILLESYHKRVYHDTLKTLVTLGRLDAQKNHAMLIDAVSIVHKSFPEVILNIYGEGKEYESLQNKIRNLHAENYIFLKGRTEDSNSVLLASDIFVFSSNFEGMPNALMEAMAQGLPCISTDCPTGPKELIGNNERGLLVKMNDVAALAEGIIYFLKHPSLAKKCGQNAHDYILENYDAEKISKLLIDECNKIIEGQV